MSSRLKKTVLRPRNPAEIPQPDRERIVRKINSLAPALRTFFPDPYKLSFKDFWLTPVQAGQICGGIGKDAVIERMYEGTGFKNCINIGRTSEQPYFRIPLEDCVDFVMERREGFFEEEL
jgi:hypothetical protein